MFNWNDEEEIEDRNKRREELLVTFRVNNPDKDWPSKSDLLQCEPCRKGRAFHSSRHPNVVNTAITRKKRVYLSNEQKQEIKNLYELGASVKDLMVQFSTTRDAIYKILKVGNIQENT